jgi:ABC-type Fe3+-hydroxamate transport system substrate-binding protein
VERILALSPHVCEILFAIGAGTEVVGVGDYCDYPRQAAALPRIANHRQVNIEAAVRLGPTMAVAVHRGLAGLARLERMGVLVVESNPERVEDVISDINRLGRVTGHEQESGALAVKLAHRLQLLRSRGSNQPVRVFYEVWPDPLITVGTSSFLNDVLAVCGAENVFGAIALESPRVNLESVTRMRPRVILVPDQHDAASRKAFWKKHLGDGIHVIAVPADLLSRPGPRLFDGLEWLTARLGEVSVE